MAGRKGNRSICEDCKKDVGSNDKALVCCVCDKWFHINCQHVPIEDYKFLAKSDDSIQWYCKSCRGASQKLFKLLTLVSKRQDQLEEEVKKLSGCLKEVNGKIDNQSSEVKNLIKDVTDMKDGMPAMISDQVSEVLINKQEEELRANNMMFFNLKEVDGGNTNEKDIEMIGDVLSSLDIDFDKSQFENVTRLGPFTSNTSKIRPVRVKIDSRAKRGEILRNAYKLRGIKKFSQVGIGRDLTKKQRENNAKLRTDLETIKKDNPGKIWVIRRDKIIELPQPNAPATHAMVGTGEID